jgi:hypothetical protein
MPEFVAVCARTDISFVQRPGAFRHEGTCGEVLGRPSGDLGAHQPVRRRFRRIDKRVAGPDVVRTQVGVLEQVRGLRVDLEGLLVEKVDIEAGLPQC